MTSFFIQSNQNLLVRSAFELKKYGYHGHTKEDADFKSQSLMQIIDVYLGVIHLQAVFYVVTELFLDFGVGKRCI